MGGSAEGASAGAPGVDCEKTIGAREMDVGVVDDDEEGSRRLA